MERERERARVGWKENSERDGKSPSIKKFYIKDEEATKRKKIHWTPPDES